MTINELFASLCSRVAYHYGITVDDILGRSRARHIADARFIVYIGAHNLGIRMIQIGELTNRHHSAVSMGIKRAQGLADVEPAYRQTIEELTR